MAAWGPGAFENDSAVDLLDEYARAGVSVVETALHQASETPEDDVLDEEVASFALAAAEIVATAFGTAPAGDGIPIDIRERHGDEVRRDEGLPAQARAAAARVVANNSTLLELWEEAGDEAAASFRSAVTDLTTRLEELK